LPLNYTSRISKHWISPFRIWKTLDYESVGQDIALRVNYHVMNVDNEFPLAIGRDLDELDMRIGPVAL
jgi:hypothetical protein